MKKYIKCDYVWLNEYREPVGCSFGLHGEGSKPIGHYCDKTKRKIRQIKEINDKK